MKRGTKTLCLLATVLVCSWVAQAQEIEDSVVKIVTQRNVFNWYAPWDSGSISKVTGSGFVIDGKRIMTNAHVVSDAALLLVYFHNDPTPYPAKLTAIAHDCDLAILELNDQKRLEVVPPLEFTELPKIRSQVFTFGYPVGGQRLSITAGIVSRIEIQLYAHSNVDQHLVVQTDAAINPGNSGGPVIQDGRVVGVAFQGNAQLENMGAFIPPPVIQHFLDDLADGIYDGFPELGLTAATLENDAAHAYAGLEKGETGIRVELLQRNCSAESALQKGDILTHINEHPIANDGTIDWKGLRLSFLILIETMQKGETFSFEVVRAGERITVPVTLNDYNPSVWLARHYDQRPQYYIYAGMVFVPLNLETLGTYGENWFTDTNQELLYNFYFRALEKNEVVDTPFVIQIRRLDHAVNAEESVFLYQIIDTINGEKVSTLQDIVTALEGNTAPQHVIHFKYENCVTILDRKQADAAHKEILNQYGIPKDRNL